LPDLEELEEAALEEEEEESEEEEEYDSEARIRDDMADMGM
jgi:hypothetical protein